MGRVTCKEDKSLLVLGLILVPHLSILLLTLSLPTPILGLPTGHIFANLILTMLIYLAVSGSKNKCYSRLEFLLFFPGSLGSKLVTIPEASVS